MLSPHDLIAGRFIPLHFADVKRQNPAFVIGGVLGISATYLPFKTSLDVVLNKPIITDEENDFDFTIGIIKEF